jgi:hypothetical protein
VFPVLENAILLSSEYGLPHGVYPCRPPYFPEGVETSHVVQLGYTLPDGQRGQSDCLDVGWIFQLRGNRHQRRESVARPVRGRP